MPDNGYKLCSVCKPYIMQELFSVCKTYSWCKLFIMQGLFSVYKTYSWYKLLSCRNFAAGVRITACG